MKTLVEIVEALTKSGYVQCKLTDNIVQDIGFLPLGRILTNNVRKEWSENKDPINTYFIPSENVIPSECTKSFDDGMHFFKSANFRQNFLHVKNNFQKEMPIAIKEELKGINYKNIASDGGLSVDIPNSTILSSCFFFSESSARENFYKIQRERKIWWMKFSSNPGRYFLSDLKTSENKNLKLQSVKIKSKFNFGNVDLEYIEMIPLKALELENQHEFTLRDPKLEKRSIPTIIRTTFPLEASVFGLLLDSVDETKKEKVNIHRKIAPYQCSLFCLSEELETLAKHLANIMRKSGIVVLNLEKCSTSEESVLRKELLNMDKIGVPYSMILEPSSLQSGLVRLRSRDTTISETIHVTDIPSYLHKIVNS